MKPFNLTPGQIGFVRGLGLIILFSVLSYLGDASHLSGVVSSGAAGIIASLALMLEHILSEKNGGETALFGAIRVK